MLVQLQFTFKESGEPLRDSAVIYSLSKRKARGIPEFRKWAPFSNRVGFRHRTDSNGFVTLPVLFHFSYYYDRESGGDEFVDALGEFRIRGDSEWIVCEISKAQTGPVAVAWVATLKDEDTMMLPSPWLHGAGEIEEKPNQAADRVPPVAPRESGRQEWRPRSP